jgi:nitronate monooxygenase
VRQATFRHSLKPLLLRAVDDLPIHPIIGAPLGGGPSTPELVAGVSNAGGLGFLAAGYKTVEGLAEDISATRRLTNKPFGVNVFYPVREDVDSGAIATYADRLRTEAERYGVALGEPRWTDDAYDAKLDLLLRESPAVVSFTFGCPEREVVHSLRDAGSAVWCTVTSVAEAQQAAGVGADALVLQGGEAGGHQAHFHDHDDDPLPVLTLVQLVSRATDLPLVAAGGLASGEGIAAALTAGACAAQVGTAFLLASEAGTASAHRDAVRRGGCPTKLTRAFSGRRARGIVNRFMREHDHEAPMGYPEIHYLTVPIRAAARQRGDADGINLWAGQAYPLAREASAGEIVEQLASEMTRTFAGS